MYGNPNQSATPYAPFRYDRQPFQQGATNPYGYGYQRVAGQLAVQRPAQGYDLNSLPHIPGAEPPDYAALFRAYFQPVQRWGYT